MGQSVFEIEEYFTWSLTTELQFCFAGIIWLYICVVVLHGTERHHCHKLLLFMGNRDFRKHLSLSHRDSIV